MDGDIVEQRILEQAARLPPHGGVTGWAALRWYGAAYFDGLAEGGRRTLPVPILTSGSDLRPHPGGQVNWEQFAPSERRVVEGLPCASVQRALFDEMRRGGRLRHAVTALDMAAAAGLISVSLMAQYVARRNAWTGVPLARRALSLATDDSRSPQECGMRLVWVIDAGLPPPRCNPPVFSLDGTLLGYPDLFDPEAGLIGEYDGADHLLDDRRVRDRDREERFRDHGLECVIVVRGGLANRHRTAARILHARDRARFTPPEHRRWTLEPPAWFQVPETLDQRLERLGLATALTLT